MMGTGTGTTGRGVGARRGGGGGAQLERRVKTTSVVMIAIIDLFIVVSYQIKKFFSCVIEEVESL